MPEPDGVFYLEKRLRFRDVMDGTSHTAAFSEHGLGDFTNAVSSRTDTFWPKTHPANADDAFQQCESIDARDLQYQRVSDVGRSVGSGLSLHHDIHARVTTEPPFLHVPARPDLDDSQELSQWRRDACSVRRFSRLHYRER